MHGMFHVVFGYVFHVCECLIVCYTLREKHIHGRMYMGNEMNMKVLNYKRSGWQIAPLREKVMTGLVHGC